MQYETLLETFDELRNNPLSFWNGCVKNQRNDFAVLDISGEKCFAPIRYVAHVAKTGKLDKGSVYKGVEFDSIVKCLKSRGFIKVKRDGSQKPRLFREYRSYYASLPKNASSNITSRDSGDMTFWVSLDDLKPFTSAAFDEYDREGIPDGFRDPKRWFVLHPDTSKPYPAKIIWGLISQQHGFKTNEAIPLLESLGLKCIKLESDETALSAEEYANAPKHVEGAVRQVTRNERERSKEARQDCINHYGAKEGGAIKCIACDLDFAQRYGPHGEGFIHVHHLDPLAEENGPRQINPTIDLVPVCPNCHAMIHRKRPYLTIKELVELLNANA